MKFSIVAHGDLDGVISSALYTAKLIRGGIKRDDIQLIFAQPFKLPEELKGDAIAVLDIALNNADRSMTESFLEKIKDRLVVWIDHHEGWDEFLKKLPEVRDKFIISKDEAAAQTVYTVTGLMEMYPLVRDAIAADTRSGEMSEKGKLVDEAIKSNLKDDSLRLAAVWWVVDGCKEDENYMKLIDAQKKYMEVKAETEKIAKNYKLYDEVAVLDVRGLEKAYDKTYLSLIGQKISPKKISVILNENSMGEDFILISTSRKDVDLVKAFDLSGGAKFRVSVKKSLEEVLEVLKKL